MNNQTQGLLPKGFVDLLSREAESEAKAISKLMKIFTQFGFQRVKPPLVEFEDSLFAPGPGSALKDSTFRLMDPLSHRMMAVRSDITPQIARIAGHLLKDEARPLRLMYANDVLRTRASQQRTERQFTKAGCEIVGSGSIEADVEIAVIALYSLVQLGVERVTIDFASPFLVRELLRHYQVDEALNQDVYDALALRALDARRDIGLELPGELTDILQALLQISAHDAKAGFAAIDKLALPSEIAAKIASVRSIFDATRAALENLGVAGRVAMNFDPVEMRGFEYHSGAAFSLFAQGIRGEIGRGGRYVCGDGAGEAACGFTLYMDTVRSAMPDNDESKRIFVPCDIAWHDIIALQDAGWRVERATDKGAVPAALCTHIWDDGTIKEL